MKEIREPTAWGGGDRHSTALMFSYQAVALRRLEGFLESQSTGT